MTGRDRTVVALHRDPGAVVAALARVVHPRPLDLASRPYVGATLADKAADRATLTEARRLWDASAVDKTSGHLDALVRGGLVHRIGPPRVADWFAARVARIGPEWALVSVYDPEGPTPVGRDLSASSPRLPRGWRC